MGMACDLVHIIATRERCMISSFTTLTSITECVLSIKNIIPEFGLGARLELRLPVLFSAKKLNKRLSLGKTVYLAWS